MILLDTNILIRVRDADNPQHSTCAQVIQQLNSSPSQGCICAQILIEYWVVATRPRNVNGLGLKATEAAEDIEEFQLLFECLPEPPDMAARWEELVKRYAVLGRHAHDARIAALMIAYGIQSILTLNPADFVSFTDINVITPHEFLEISDAG